MTVLAEMRARVSTASRSRTLRLLPAATALSDLGLVAVSILIAVAGRRRLGFVTGEADVAADLILVGPLLIVGWVALIYFSGGYRLDIFGAGTDEYKRVLNASLLAAGLLGVACYLARFPLSRGFFLLAFGIGIPTLLAGRWLSRRALHRARVAGKLQQAVVIAGTAPHIDEIAGVLRREAWLGYDVIGAVTPPDDQRHHTPSGIAVLGHTTDISAVVVETEADVVFFAGGSVGSGAKMRQAVWDLEQHHVQVVVAPSVTDISRERVKVRPVGGLPLMHIDPPTWANAAKFGKRIFDVVIASLLLVVLSPVLLACVLAVKLSDRGPVLFRQRRIGRHGAEFSCLKFRSMVVDAERQLADLHAEHGYEHGLFKVKDDPRVTRPGRLAAPLLDRRAAAAVQRPARRDEPRRPASAAPPRGRALRPGHLAPAARATGHDRSLAGLGPLRPHLGGGRSGSTSTTSTTGRCSRTSASCPRPCAPSSPAAAPTEPASAGRRAARAGRSRSRS